MTRKRATENRMGSTAGPRPSDAQRRAAIAALVSTVLLFGLLLGGAWLGGAVYEALPMGPFPKSRIVSAGSTVLVLLGGYIVWSRVVAPRLGGGTIRTGGSGGGPGRTGAGGQPGANRASSEASRRRDRGGKRGSGRRSR
jgi:hypothetical protein